jgi:NAD(P)-dependent dehydrogenase (short-subunit alcohol dehydrogenase family)
VNSVHPGFIDTPILDQTRGTEIEDAMLAWPPMGRLGLPGGGRVRRCVPRRRRRVLHDRLRVYVDGGYLVR